MSSEAVNMFASNPSGLTVVEPAVESLRDSVFYNDVFWSLLGKYLNFGDLKVCRLVSQNFSRKVLDETNFKRRAVIKLSKELLHPDIFGSTVEKWKNVHILAFALNPGSEPAIDLNWLHSHLSDLEELHVLAFTSLDESENYYPPIHKLLEGTNCLKKLSLDQTFLNQTDVSIHLPFSQAVDDTLANLTELEVKTFWARPKFSTFPGKFGKWVDYLATALKNVTVLSTEGVVPEDLEFPEQMGEDMHPKVQNILQIIEDNYSHLTTLNLDNMQLWFTSCNESLLSLSRKVFPRLSSVKIRVNQNEAKHMIKFLKQHPLVREIDVTDFSQFPAELLNVIMERKELNRLRIKIKRFEESSPILWERLSELNALDVFELHLVRPYRISSHSDLLASCLAHLPQSVKKIYLKGMQNLPMRDHNKTVLAAETFSNLNPALLTELCISKSGICLSDDILEFIFRNFRFLRVLNISHNGGNCTDYGFTGRPLKPNSTPFSISNLLGLRHLTLIACGVITDETLIHGIKFMELSCLDVSNNENITLEGFRAVLAQNPSLEVFKTSDLALSVRSDELKKLYPRLEKLEFSDGDIFDLDENSDSDSDIDHDRRDARDYDHHYDYEYDSDDDYYGNDYDSDYDYLDNDSSWRDSFWGLDTDSD